MYLRTKDPAGLSELIPLRKVLRVEMSASIVPPATAYSTGGVSEGRITDISYLAGGAAVPPFITLITAIPDYSGDNMLYELVRLGPDGAYLTLASNRKSLYYEAVAAIFWDAATPWDGGVNWS